jgi:predicted nucleic acid-binding protein
MAKIAKKIILLDTNILIDILQGDKNLEESIYQLGVTRCAISVITKTEIIAGMRKGEVQKTKTLLNKFRTYHISLNTSKVFLELINFIKSKNREIFIADCLIAATAIDYNLILYTFNRKDFDFLPKIDLFNS